MSAKTIDEVIGRLDEIIEGTLHTASANGYFAVLYRRVTVGVKTRLAEGDYFEDNARMEELDVIFANRYLDAYEGYRTRANCSEVWRIAFEAAKDGKPIVLQHLLIGMNAHIGFDLAIAAAEVAPGSSIDGLKKDFQKINELLAAEVDSVQSALARITPFLKVLDKLGGQLDEDLAKFSMDIARDRAWRTATDLAGMAGPAFMEQYLQQRAQKVAAFSKRLYRPKFLFRCLLRLIRTFERGDVRSRIRMLMQG